MTEDETAAREQIIEAMAQAYIKRWQGAGSRFDCIKAAFDAIHPLAAVVPRRPVGTMYLAAREFNPVVTLRGMDAAIAAGDLTREPKP